VAISAAIADPNGSHIMAVASGPISLAMMMTRRFPMNPSIPNLGKFLVAWMIVVAPRRSAIDMIMGSASTPVKRVWLTTME
jgi:hypothetical protein